MNHTLILQQGCSDHCDSMAGLCFSITEIKKEKDELHGAEMSTESYHMAMLLNGHSVVLL